MSAILFGPPCIKTLNIFVFQLKTFLVLCTFVCVLITLAALHLQSDNTRPWPTQRDLQGVSDGNLKVLDSTATRGPPPKSTFPPWARGIRQRPVEVSEDSEAMKLPAAQPAHKPFQFHGRSKHDGRWEYIRGPGREVYVYSAFYDDRESLKSKPEVRVIAAVEIFPINETLYCHVRYAPEKRLKPRVGVAKMIEIGFGALRHWKTFKTFVLSCPMTDYEVPRTVSIVNQPYHRPSFLLPVEVADKDDKKLDFGACISVSYWTFKPHRLVEWMEMMQILGVGEVTIYNNTLDPASARVFQYYDQKGYVDFRQSHNFIHDNGEVTLHMHMTPVINDCMYRNMFRYRKILVIDLDELIIPMIHMTLKQLLAAVERTTEHVHMARSYMFRNVYAFLDLPPDKKESPRLATLSHRRFQPPSERGYSVKTIVDPLACTSCHNHVCWGYTTGYDTPGFLNEVPPYLGVNMHYKKCHLEGSECEEAYRTAELNNVMIKYKPQLIQRVPHVLKDLGLDPLWY